MTRTSPLPQEALSVVSSSEDADVAISSSPLSLDQEAVPLSRLREQEEEMATSIRRLEEEVDTLKQQKESLREVLATLETQGRPDASGENSALVSPHESPSAVAVCTAENDAAAIRSEIYDSLSSVNKAEDELLAAIEVMRQTLLEVKRTRLLQELDETPNSGSTQTYGTDTQGKDLQTGRALFHQGFQRQRSCLGTVSAPPVRGEGERRCETAEEKQQPKPGEEGRRNGGDCEREDADAVVVVTSDDESSGMSFSEGEEGEATGDVLKDTHKNPSQQKDPECRCIFPVVHPDGIVDWQLGVVRALLQSPSPLHIEALPSSFPAHYAAQVSSVSLSSQEADAAPSDLRLTSLCVKWCRQHRARFSPSPVKPAVSLSSSDPSSNSDASSNLSATDYSPRIWALVTALCPLAPRDIPCRHLLQFLRPHSVSFSSFVSCESSLSAFPLPEGFHVAAGNSTGEATEGPRKETPEAAAAAEAAVDAGMVVVGNAQAIAERMLCTDTREAALLGVTLQETATSTETEVGREREGEVEGRHREETAKRLTDAGSAFVPSAAYVEEGCPYSWRCHYSHGVWVPACDVCLVQWDSEFSLNEMLRPCTHESGERNTGVGDAVELQGKQLGGNSSKTKPLFYRGRPVFVLPDGSQTWRKAQLVQALRKRRRRKDFVEDQELKGRPSERSLWSMYGRVVLENETEDGACRKQRLLCRASRIHPRVASSADENKAEGKGRDAGTEREASCDREASEKAKQRRRSERDERQDVIVLDSGASGVASSSSEDEGEEETHSGPSDEEEGSERWQKLRRLEALLGVNARDLRDRFSSGFSRKRDNLSHSLSSSSSSSGSSASASEACPLSSSSHFGCWMLYTSGMGLRMMQRWGYRPGECLGRSQRLQLSRQPGDRGREGTGKTELDRAGESRDFTSHLRRASLTKHAPPSNASETGGIRTTKDDAVPLDSYAVESSDDEAHDEGDGEGRIIWPGEAPEMLSSHPSLPPLVNPLGIRVLPPRLSLDFISDPAAARRRGRNRRRGADGVSSDAGKTVASGSWQYAEGALVPSFCSASASCALAREAAVANDGAFGLINSIYSSGFTSVARQEPGREKGGADAKSHGPSTEAVYQEEVAGGERTLGPMEIEENRRKQEEEEHLRRLQQLRRNKTVGEKALRKQLFDLQQRQRALKKEIGAATANQRRHADGGKARGGLEAFAGYYGGIASAKETQLRRMKEEEDVLLKLISDKGKEKKLKVF
ncbi:hypothetical protein TGMAS_258490 [Toxoplasma gondii MAS]|uniref:G-patch domain-containing protein n=1 Tax=Toxoplasma gondii MAS TaxID=943118 RepID=A0A086QKX9_TOXGO|nr:hypothetical protein TGMAS_258490 [Toxoplasma gondii MAS]